MRTKLSTNSTETNSATPYTSVSTPTDSSRSLPSEYEMDVEVASSENLVQSSALAATAAPSNKLGRATDRRSRSKAKSEIPVVVQSANPTEVHSANVKITKSGETSDVILLHDLKSERIEQICSLAKGMVLLLAQVIAGGYLLNTGISLLRQNGYKDVGEFVLGMGVIAVIPGTANIVEKVLMGVARGIVSTNSASELERTEQRLNRRSKGQL